MCSMLKLFLLEEQEVVVPQKRHLEEVVDLRTRATRLRDVCTQSCATTVHEKMWRAAGVSVYTPSIARKWNFRKAK